MAAETHPGSNNRGSYGPFRTLLATQSWRIAQFGLKLKAEIVEEARAKKIKPEAAFLRPGMTHIEPSKLFGVVKGSIEFDESEREHLKNCEECSRVFAAFQTYFAEGAATGKSDTCGRGSVIEYGRLQRLKQGY